MTCNLDDIKKRTNDEILNYWKNIGFLDDLTDEDSMNVAKLMNDMAIFLMESGDKYTTVNIPVLVFPMIRRAYRGGISDKYTPERMCDLIEHTFMPFANCIETWGDDIDVEAEYCAAFSQVFSKVYRV